VYYQKGRPGNEGYGERVPKRVDHEERRRQIADALLRTATTRGLHATGMREVAAEAGVSLRLVQYYFGTKEELMLFAMQHLATQFGERGMARIRRLKSSAGAVRPCDVIAAILTEGLPADDERRTFTVLYTAYFALSLTDPALAIAPLLRSSDVVINVVAAQLRAAQAAGDTPAHLDPDTEAFGLMAMSAGLGTSARETAARGRRGPPCGRRSTRAVPAIVRPPATADRVIWSASGGAEIGQHGQHSAVIAGAVRKVELAEDAVHVLFHGCLGDPDLPGDPRVRAALGHQRENLPLPGGQHVKRIVARPGANQVLHQCRVDHHATVGDALQRLDELRDVFDTVFEQVTDPLPAGKQFHRVLGVDEGRQHHDAGLRELLADGQRRPEPLGGMPGRHPDVDHGEIRALRPDQGDDAR
jgi:AcrR family transcriptional regulator